MNCTKCSSDNVTFSMVAESKEVSKHGLLYKILIGWWIWIIKWIFFTAPALLLKMFGIGGGKKTVTRAVKYGICQNCGHSWKIES